MGENLFLAIRGGGGASFGVILEWKLSLVTVPKTVTIFTVSRTLEQNATKLVHRWQYIADKIDENLFIRVVARNVNSSEDGKKTIEVSFFSLFLGEVDKLLSLMEEEFPELGLVRKDCFEVSWIDSVLFFYGVKLKSLDDLLNRAYPYRSNYKIKSDYVKEPIPESAFEGIWERFSEVKDGDTVLVLTPYGGKMSEIANSETPFPHRAGNIYKIEYQVGWEDQGIAVSERHQLDSNAL